MPHAFSGARILLIASAHADLHVHFLRDMVLDGAAKLIKCAGTYSVAGAPTKSLPKLAFHRNREFLHGTAQSFAASLQAHECRLLQHMSLL
jgi:hypothetical protein